MTRRCFIVRCDYALAKGQPRWSVYDRRAGQAAYSGYRTKEDAQDAADAAEGGGAA